MCSQPKPKIHEEDIWIRVFMSSQQCDKDIQNIRVYYQSLLDDKDTGCLDVDYWLQA